MAEERNLRTIRNPRFNTNRAVGFRSRPLSTTGNLPPPTPTTAPIAPARPLTTATTRRPREEDEEGSPGGRDFGRIAPSGGGSRLRFDQGDTGQGGVRTQGNVRGLNLGDTGRLIARGLTAIAPAPANLIGLGLLAADKLTQREREKLPPSTPVSGDPGNAFDRAIGRSRATDPLDQGFTGQPGPPVREEGGDDNRNDFDRAIDQSRQTDPLDQGFTGQPGPPTREEGQDDNRGGFDSGGPSTGPEGGGGFSEREQEARSQGFFNRGGLVRRTSTRAYASGGLIEDDPRPGVEGVGDGNDDTVSAPQVSDGEYVLPADVVSAIGDGDTDSGAARLDQLVQQIRQQAMQRMAATPPPVGAEQRAGPTLNNIGIGPAAAAPVPLR